MHGPVRAPTLILHQSVCSCLGCHECHTAPGVSGMQIAPLFPSSGNDLYQGSACCVIKTRPAHCCNLNKTCITMSLLLALLEGEPTPKKFSLYISVCIDSPFYPCGAEGRVGIAPGANADLVQALANSSMQLENADGFTLCYIAFKAGQGLQQQLRETSQNSDACRETQALTQGASSSPGWTMHFVCRRGLNMSDIILRRLGSNTAQGFPYRSLDQKAHSCSARPWYWHCAYLQF